MFSSLISYVLTKCFECIWTLGNKLRRQTVDDIKRVAGKAQFPSCRLVLMVIGFFTYVNFHTLRVDLSVAIVAMVNATHLRKVDAAAIIQNTSSQQSALFDQREQCANDHDSNKTLELNYDNVRIACT